jgi:ABC-2 type transport system permease protein
MTINATIFLIPFKPIIERSGANFKQVCQLVDLKLLLDNRKSNPNSSRQSKDPNNTLLRQSILYVFVGTMLSLMFLKSNDLFLITFSSHIYLMVMVAISMLTEYSVSLFDTRDNNLLIPLPANGQTLGWARVLHIMVYLLLLTMSLILPSVVMTGIKFGIVTSLLLLVSAILNTVFTLFFTIFFYLGLMKFTSGDKLKDVMMYIQVGLTIAIMIGYQFGPRYLMNNEVANQTVQHGWYFLLIPPAWFSMLSSIMENHENIIIPGSILAVLVPIISMLFIGKKLFYGFENKLSQLSSGDVSNSKADNKKRQNENGFWFQMVSLILGVPKNELPLFRLMWKLTGRERLFKQSILPMIAYMVVIPLFSILTVKNLGDIQTKYLTFLYFTVMTSSMIPFVISIGNNTQTIWIYRSIPAIKPASVISNSLKAAFGKFFVPIFFIMVLPLFYFKGVKAIADIITIFLFNYFAAYAILLFQAPAMPFSQTRAAAQGGKTALRMMLIIFIAFPIGMLHAYLSKLNGWLSITPSLLLLPGLLLIDKKWFPEKITWKKVELANKA